MNQLERKHLVDAYRAEFKQRARLRPDTRTDEEVRQANFSRWLNTADRRRPRLPRDATNEQRREHHQATRRYQSDIRSGFRVGEALREGREGTLGIDRSSEVAARAIRRSNVRFQTRTQNSGPNGIIRSLTPSERVNLVGVRSRRRRVSPGVAPLASRRGVVGPPLLPPRRR